MLRPRVIPCLLLKDKGLVKTVQFANPKYVGDPINSVYIFNSEEADEIIFLDIMATKNNSHISIDFVSKISDECFMPLTVGGGIRSTEDIRDLLRAGAEKVAINTYAIENPSFIKEASRIFGSQSIVISMDVKLQKNGRYEVYTHGGSRPTGTNPVDLAKLMESQGAGEILLNSIDKDGTWTGYDIALIKSITESVRVPVIACGGAASMKDLAEAIYLGHASAATAGSMFVFHGKKHAVLINFPSKDELEKYFHDFELQLTKSA